MKKVILFFLFSILITSISYSQYVFSDATDNKTGEKYSTQAVTWVPTSEAAGDWCPSGTFPDLPGASIYAAAEWLGDTLYFQAPASGTPSTTVYKYTYGGSWTTGVPTPVALGAAAMVACNGKLYLFGGGTTTVSTGTTTALSYDPGTGTWTNLAPMPVALSGHGAACWGDSVIFVYGGPWSGSATNLDVHYYRVASNTWGTISGSIPTGMGRRTFGYGLVDGNKLIMCAGYNTTYLKSLLVGEIGANATQITWTMGPDVPTGYAGLSRPGGTGIFKYFYLVGGERSGGGYHDTAYVFDATVNNWVDNVPGKPLACSNIFSQVTSTAFDDSIRVFAPGGYNVTYYATFDAIACGQLLVIPVELTSFTASALGNEVTLNWRTATEVNNSGFEVERNSGAGFVKIGFVPGIGTSSEPNLYSFTDADLKAGEYSYRLKQVDYDGSFEYSQEISVELTTPSVFVLEQNYPNPFNPSTTIAFSLAAEAKVSLKIFNTLGQEVTQIVNSNMNEGYHEVNFDASAYNSGVYFYKIEAQGIDGQNFTQVRKMMLTK
jgi:hypothetical protein